MLRNLIREILLENYNVNKELEIGTNRILDTLSKIIVANSDDEGINEIPDVDTSKVSTSDLTLIVDLLKKPIFVKFILKNHNPKGVKGTFARKTKYEDGYDDFTIKIHYTTHDLEQINDIFNKSVEDGFDVDGSVIKFELNKLFGSTMLHELTHAYDSFRSNDNYRNGSGNERYKALAKEKDSLLDKDKSNYTPEELEAIKRGHNAYLNLTHEINARFSQAIKDIHFTTVDDEHNWMPYVKPFKDLLYEFEITFTGWDVLSNAMKRRLIKRLVLHYNDFKEEFETKNI